MAVCCSTAAVCCGLGERAGVQGAPGDLIPDPGSCCECPGSVTLRSPCCQTKEITCLKIILPLANRTHRSFFQATWPQQEGAASLAGLQPISVLQILEGFPWRPDVLKFSEEKRTDMRQGAVLEE